MTRWTSIIAALVAVAAIVLGIAWALQAAVQRTRDLATAAATAAIGRQVSIGRISGNPWRGVVVEDVRIAPDAAAGAGEAISARRVTIHFDPRALLRDLWRRRGIAGSVVQIIVDEPVVPVLRHADGRWNFEGLRFGAAGPGAGSPFAGRLIVIDGTVTFVDRHRLSPRTFEARLEDLNGTADFSSPPRVGWRGSFVEHRGDRRVSVRSRGSFSGDTGTLDVDLDAADADAGAWGPYILATPLVQIAGGRFDAKANILRSQRDGQSTIDVQARIAVRDGRAVMPDRQATLTRIAGDVAIANRSISTTGLRGAVNGSPLEVRGEMTFYGEPRLDLVLRSRAMNLATLRRVLFPGSQMQLRGVAAGDVRVTGPITLPWIEGRVTAARGAYERRPFAAASGDFALLGRTLRVTDARAETEGARVQADAWWTVDRPDYAFSLRFENASPAVIAKWAPAPVPLEGGRASGALTALNRGASLTVVGRASVSQPVVSGIAMDAADAVFRSDPRGVTLDQLRASRGASRLWMAGRVAPDGALSLSATAADLDLATMPGMPAQDLASGGLLFSGRIGGSLRSPEVSGAAVMSKGRLRNLEVDSARGRIVLRLGQLDFQQVRGRADRALFDLSGRVDWRRGLRLDMDISAERAPAGTLAGMLDAPVEVTGLVDGRVRVQGPASRPAASGRLTVRRAQALGQSVDEASATFRWDGTRLTLEQGTARRKQSTVEFGGTLSRRSVDLDFSARAFELGDLALSTIGATRVEGQIDVSGRVTGRGTSPVVTADASSSSLLVNGRRFDEAAGRVRWTGQTLTLDPVSLRQGAERYDLTGDIAFNGAPSTRLTATIESGRLSTLLSLANVRLNLPLEATISGQASLDGSVTNPAARLDLRLSDGRFGPHRLVDGRANLTLRDGAVTIEEFVVRPQRGTIAALGRLDLRGESQVELSGSDLDLDLLRPLFRLGRPLTGRLNFTTQLGGTLAQPEIGFSLDLRRAGVVGATFDSLVANAFYRDGLLQVQQALLVQNGHKLRASGVAPFNPALLRFDEQRPVDFRISLVDTNLSLVQVLTDRVEQATGAIEGEVRLTGNIGALRAAGGLQMRDGRIRLRGLQTPIEAIRLGLRFDDNTIRIEEGTARVGGGEARLEGAVRLLTLSPPGLALVVSEDAPLVLHSAGARIIYPPLLDVRTDGQLRFWGAIGAARQPVSVNGRMTLSDGTISVTQEDAGPAPSLPLAFRGVRIEAGRNLAVQLGDLRAELKPGGALLLTGTMSAPALDGTLEAQEGKIAVRGVPFDLRRATATFQAHQGIRPSVEAEAEKQIVAAGDATGAPRTTQILLRVYGSPPELRREFRSEPELREQEILLLLAREAGFGRLLGGDVEAQVRAEIGRYLFGPVTLAIGRALGLTELTIEYDFRGPLALRAGKLLLRDLYLTYSTTFGASQQGLTGRWLLALEYRFARNWQFTLGLDSLGQREAIFWYTVRF